MRVIRCGVWVKTVPKKFEPVLEGFYFTSIKKRLQPDERYALIQRLIHYRFSGTMYTYQERFAQNCVDMHVGDFDIIKVNKRDYFQWRIMANGVEINVSEDLVSDCPKEFLKLKNEF